ncbi:MAG TPA: hypothetical protein VFA20_14310 [Myxococcaceae bacterium]|nr:hypothetical protein [Myxococcaceae bacterium]
MSHDYAQVARYNASLTLEECLPALGAPSPATADQLANLAIASRVLGICAILLDADQGSFATMLRQAGQARLALLRVSRQPPGITPQPMTSETIGFSDALAGGDLDLAREVARLSPFRHFPGEEYEEDFLFGRALHLIALRPMDRTLLPSLLDRFEALDPSGADAAKLAVCRALAERAAPAFEEAFVELCRERDLEAQAYRKRTDFDPEVHATTFKLYVDGLAVRALARGLGLPEPPLMPMVPSLARVDVGT